MVHVFNFSSVCFKWINKIYNFFNENDLTENDTDTMIQYDYENCNENVIQNDNLTQDENVIQNENVIQDASSLCIPSTSQGTIYVSYILILQYVKVTNFF